MSHKKSDSESANPKERARVGANPYAVPELPESPHSHLITARVLPEASEENEENLIVSPSVSRRSDVSFSADRFEKWFVLLLFFLGTLCVMATSSRVGMAWDEAFYLDMAKQTVNWVDACTGAGSAPISGPALDAYWALPEGHPSVTRFLLALGYAARERVAGYADGDSLMYMRGVVALCFGFTLVCVVSSCASFSWPCFGMGCRDGLFFDAPCFRACPFRRDGNSDGAYVGPGGVCLSSRA